MIITKMVIQVKRIESYSTTNYRFDNGKFTTLDCVHQPYFISVITELFVVEWYQEYNNPI